MRENEISIYGKILKWKNILYMYLSYYFLSTNILAPFNGANFYWSVIYINTQEIKLEDLKVYENNPRINDKAIKYVANSIKKFGFLVPIVIDKNNVIVCGHTRYLASKELNLKFVPCIRVENLTPKQIKAFRIADNKIHEKSSWDNDLLKKELTQLQDFGFNLEELGFLDFELDFILNDNTENFIDDLEENDFNSENLLNKFFSMTFVFPKDKEESIKDYISQNGKEAVVNKIISWVEEG